MQGRNANSEVWRRIRRDVRERALRRMQRDLLLLSRIEERGLIRVQVVNPDMRHTRVFLGDNPEAWVDFYPTRGTVMLRGRGRAELRGVPGVLASLGLDPAIVDEVDAEAAHG